MLAIVDIIVPIFGIVALGYAATFTPVFDGGSARALSRFVFFFAIPAMLFQKVATTEPAAGNAWSLLATFYGANLVIYAVGGLTARFAFARAWDEAALLGFAACYGNTVLVGIPVVLTVIGPDAAFPLFLVISFHSLLLFTLTTLLVELARGAGRGLAHLPREVAKATLSNPILVALLSGIVFNRLGLALPSTLAGFAELLGEAAIPCALFATGAALREFEIKAALPLVAVLVALKGVVHPLLVTLLAQAFGLSPLWAAVAILLASMPIGVNPYLFAARYGRAEAECATAVAVSTPVAILTVSAALLTLGLAG